LKVVFPVLKCSQSTVPMRPPVMATFTEQCPSGTFSYADIH